MKTIRLKSNERNFHYLDEEYSTICRTLMLRNSEIVRNGNKPQLYVFNTHLKSNTFAKPLS